MSGSVSVGKSKLRGLKSHEGSADPWHQSQPMVVGVGRRLVKAGQRWRATTAGRFAIVVFVSVPQSPTVADGTVNFNGPVKYILIRRPV